LQPTWPPPKKPLVSPVTEIPGDSGAQEDEFFALIRTAKRQYCTAGGADSAIKRLNLYLSPGP
jgi:hypothetical protein